MEVRNLGAMKQISEVEEKLFNSWSWDGGHEQLISNGGRFKPAFAKRDQAQTMIDLQVQ